MNALALTHNEVYYFSIKIAFVHRGSVFVAVFTEALCDLPNYGNNSRTCERKKLTKLFGCSVPHRGTRHEAWAGSQADNINFESLGIAGSFGVRECINITVKNGVLYQKLSHYDFYCSISLLTGSSICFNIILVML